MEPLIAQRLLPGLTARKPHSALYVSTSELVTCTEHISGADLGREQQLVVVASVLTLRLVGEIDAFGEYRQVVIHTIGHVHVQLTVGIDVLRVCTLAVARRRQELVAPVVS